MEHVVFFPGPDGKPAFERAPSLEDALRVVERLRNVDGVADVSVFSLGPVPLAFKAYYRVEVPAAAPAEPAMPAPAAESVAAAEAPAPAESAEVPAPAEAVAVAPVEVPGLAPMPAETVSVPEVVADPVPQVEAADAESAPPAYVPEQAEAAESAVSESPAAPVVEPAAEAPEAESPVADAEVAESEDAEPASMPALEPMVAEVADVPRPVEVEPEPVGANGHRDTPRSLGYFVHRDA